ncbi:hypothetical protein KKJ09_11065 [Xenorhabdus bovienii]|uniref:Uncharacterized protein n=1 Tax=Xenorhabdus bovienii str. feltiae Moldova TaxID=1398200 RepID=A0A077NSE5_XENBV|nr:hypothetical protein [Xenorhabdus bovienii]MDE9494118.1 hypothetical protein [Xenorhabdus bovienii]MDE9502655.1 hypothetical protein [Xenorhabdus bovienii]MDE9525352.1 hypothetical protein [Xenorhabdus bovienii]CDH00521.1 conserved hypothetical protein [Xenorhabdus bovienii str. feltiae Moldova]
MTPENSTEKLLIDIANDNSRLKENKIGLIKETAYPNQDVNYAAGKPCAVCPPPQARPEFVEILIRSLDKRFTVTIYAAHPGTPLNNDDGTPHIEKDKRVTSAAGHMWYKISDGNVNDSYGFAPIESGILGDGRVTKEDTIHYENPRYSRTLEITEEHYNKLKEYGELAKTGSNPDFNLYYNGGMNSCIDFTWKALRSAGLIPEITWNDFTEFNKINKVFKKFDGDVKVDNNIPHIKSIPAPFPDSELNKQHYNKPPKKTLQQILLTQTNSNKADSNETDIKIS